MLDVFIQKGGSRQDAVLEHRYRLLKTLGVPAVSRLILGEQILFKSIAPNRKVPIHSVAQLFHIAVDQPQDPLIGPLFPPQLPVCLLYTSRCV